MPQPIQNTPGSLSIRSLPLLLGKGMGQIMLQDNAITGLLFFIGVSMGSVAMGAAMLLATFTGTKTAIYLSYQEKDINKGLYGFSPALTGVGLLLFFEPVPITWLAVIFGSVAACMMQHFFIKKNIPVFTFPFVLVTWCLIFILKNWLNISESSLLSSTLDASIPGGFIVRNYGQVIFQGDYAVGVIFFIGVFISSQPAGFFGLLGGVVGAGLAYLLFQPTDAIQAGLFGFNAVLSAIAFTGNKKTDLIRASLAALLSTMISILMLNFNLIQLTFPFVAATCPFVYIKSWREKKFI